MKTLGLLAAGIAAATLAAAPAVAQVREYDQREFFIEGVNAYCPEMQTAVFNTMDTLIKVEGGIIIQINGPAFDTLPAGVRLFVYFQTCAELFYTDLAQADAQAALIGIDQRWLSAADVEAMCTTPILADAGWANAPDAARCEGIYQTMRGALL